MSRLFAILSFCFALAGAPASAVDSGADLEATYADFLDAHGAVEAIEAGAMPAVEGHDVGYWKARSAEKSEKINLYFNNIKNKSHNLLPHNAQASLLRTFQELSQDGTDSTAVSARCEDAANPSLQDARLSAALYACFDSPGNQIAFEGRRMTRVAALQSLQEIEEPARREALFRALEPLWRAINAGNEADSPYRRLIRAHAAAFAHGQSPVHEAAASFGISAQEAQRWLVRILQAWAAANHGGAPVEPWDYRYRYSAASRALSASIPRDALLPLQQRFFADLGADPRRLGVLFDIDPRPGKAPLAYSDTVRIGRMIGGHWRPALVRVSANDDRGGLGVLNELVHETGHAVHFMAIRARPALFWPDTTFIEAFADVPSWSVYAPRWQSKYLSRAVSRADGLREQYAGVMLDVAWALFEMRVLQNPALDPNRLWTDITGRYLNIVPHPELSWWAVRSQLVSDPGYMVHYGLGAVITAEIRTRTAAVIGGFDAGNPRWYPWLSSQLLASGDALPAHERLRNFLGHPASPAALLADIASISSPHRP